MTPAKLINWDMVDYQLAAILGTPAPAIIPEAPRPIIEGHGWEATDWTDCPMAQRYGVAGDCRSSRRRSRK